MTILHGLVLEEATFHTQIMYNLWHHIAKILLQSYLKQPSHATIPCADTFED
jgi:hypothetical protein